MHHRLAGAVLAALSILACAGANAQSQDPPERKQEPAEQKQARPEPDNVPTPIRQFSDAAGQWYGMVDLTTRVTMYIGADGMVKFWGPRDVTQQAQILHDRLWLQSRTTDLDCGLMNGFLVCNARFGTWYAALSMRRQ